MHASSAVPSRSAHSLYFVSGFAPTSAAVSASHFNGNSYSGAGVTLPAGPGGAYTSFAFGHSVGTGQHALLHTMRYSAANSPNEYRWLSPSVVGICATRRICGLRRPAGNGTRLQGIGVGPPGAQPSG